MNQSDRNEVGLVVLCDFKRQTVIVPRAAGEQSARIA